MSLITLTFEVEDVVAEAAYRGIEITENEAVTFIRENQNTIEDRMSELCWEVIGNFLKHKEALT